jgi:diguanylate cyclase (GGDEF)-like protein
MTVHFGAAGVRAFAQRLDGWPPKGAPNRSADLALRRDLQWATPTVAALSTLAAVVAMALGDRPTLLRGAAVFAALGMVPVLVGGLARRLARRLEVAITEREVFQAALDAAGRMREAPGDRANHDHLTGLPNRSVFYDRLALAIAGADRQTGLFALLFLDVDDFKDVNDRFGHATGDRLLVELASRIRMNVRTGDTVARFGGDEFVVLLDGVRGRRDAEGVAEDVLDAAQAPYRFDGDEITVVLSLGVSMYPGDGASADELVGRANAATYGDKDRPPIGPEGQRAAGLAPGARGGAPVTRSRDAGRGEAWWDD